MKKFNLFFVALFFPAMLYANPIVIYQSKPWHMALLGVLLFLTLESFIVSLVIKRKLEREIILKWSACTASTFILFLIYCDLVIFSAYETLSNAQMIAYLVAGEALVVITEAIILFFISAECIRRSVFRAIAAVLLSLFTNLVSAVGYIFYASWYYSLWYDPLPLVD